MTKRLFMISVSLLALLVSVSCIGGDDSSASHSPVEDPLPGLAGKADFLDEFPELERDAVQTGYAAGRSIKQFYRLKLYAGAEIEIEMTGLDGDLKPYLKLYRVGATSYLRSESTARNGKWLQRDYTIKKSGDYVVMARAYRFKGAGTFEIVYYCNFGPCDETVATETPVSDPPAVETVEDMHFMTRGACLEKAEECALQAAVTQTKTAKEILDSCLSVTEVSGKPCGGLCSLVDTQDVCKHIETETELVLNHGDPCRLDLISCVYDCLEAKPSDWWSDEFGQTAIATCQNKDDWNCYHYATQFASCGGPGFPTERDDCIMHQAATLGHFFDIVPDWWCD
jgi:hypothetical protein